MMPAARITDMHVCPMVTPGVPPIPHVKNKQLLFRQNYPYAGEPVFKKLLSQTQQSQFSIFKV